MLHRAWRCCKSCAVEGALRNGWGRSLPSSLSTAKILVLRASVSYLPYLLNIKPSKCWFLGFWLSMFVVAVVEGLSKPAIMRNIDRNTPRRITCRRLTVPSWDGLVQVNPLAVGVKEPWQLHFVSSFSTSLSSAVCKHPATNATVLLQSSYIWCLFVLFLQACSTLEKHSGSVVRGQSIDLSEATTCKAVNFFMSSLYKRNSFIPSDEARAIVAAGRHFLKGYSRLALLCHRSSLSRFPAMPKSHMLWHVLHWMSVQCEAVPWVMNPASESTASDEDFIGKFCLLTRCVSPRQRIKRSYERYFCQLMMMWLRDKWTNRLAEGQRCVTKQGVASLPELGEIMCSSDQLKCCILELAAKISVQYRNVAFSPWKIRLMIQKTLFSADAIEITRF